MRFMPQEIGNHRLGCFLDTRCDESWFRMSVSMKVVREARYKSFTPRGRARGEEV
jgi:hypothetical protein